MPIDPNVTTVGELVAINPLYAAVFDRHGIDFCCGGGAMLAAACESKGLDAEAVAAELAEIDLPDDDQIDWREAPIDELIAYIVETHHGYLREHLPRLRQLAIKVARVHGGRHPVLLDIAETFEALRIELTEHLGLEEDVVFPAITRVERPGDLQTPFSKLEHDHQVAGDALLDLRRLTNHFEPPADACASYRALFAGLADLERDVHRHIHLENNVLFPRVLAG